MLSRLLPIAAMLLLTGLAAAAAEPSSPPPRIQFGIQTGQQNVTWADIQSTWKEAEALGFDSAWVWDHFIPITGDRNGSCLEGFTLLSALAAQTQKIRIGVLVTGNTYRNLVTRGRADDRVPCDESLPITGGLQNLWDLYRGSSPCASKSHALE